MNLATTYLGFELPHPFMAGASPIPDSVDGAKRLEDAGAAAVCMRSLFEEQILAETIAMHSSTDSHADSSGEATSYFPDHDEYVIGPDEYLQQISRLREALDIPVFASLNGSTDGGWLEYAASIEQAGASALELNLYDVAISVDEPAEAREKRTLDMVRDLRKATKLPLAAKLSPFYTALPNFAKQLTDAGVNGLVLFNRFFEPDIDIEELEAFPHLELSDRSELLLRLRWLAILSSQLDCSFAASGGVHAVEDAVKAIMCGSHVVQMVSTVLSNGPEQIATLREGLTTWMQEMDYESLNQMRGSMNAARCPDPGAYHRANYLRLLQTWTRQLTF